MSMQRTVTRGRPWPLGVTVDGSGINVAVFSAHAQGIDLCLFNETESTESERIPLPFRDGDVWHAHVSDVKAGARYGLRASGEYDPLTGLRFNEAKLLIDPYARALDRPLRWHPEMSGYAPGPDDDFIASDDDSAPVIARGIVTDGSFDWAQENRPRYDFTDSVIYEAHVKGLTAGHPGVDAAVRGTYLGLISEPIIEHLTDLGVTAIELLPVFAFLDDRFLVDSGLTNFWGYQPIGFFAPEPRYAINDAVVEFKQMVRGLHQAGLEVILDVVFNHTGEGNELGPTLSMRGLDNVSYYRLLDQGRHYADDTGTGNTIDVSHPAVLRLVLDCLRYWVTEMHVDGFRFDLATTLGREDHGFNPTGTFFHAIGQDPILSRVKLIAEPWDIGPGGYQVGHFPHPFREWNDRFRDGIRQVWRGEAFATADLGSRLLGSAGLFEHSGRGATSSVNLLTAHDGFTLEDVVSYSVKHNEANGENNADGHGENYSDNLGVEGPTDDPDVIARRAARKRAMLATLFVAQGVPMLLAGDELGNSQAGNNNAYAQDNEIGWVDWTGLDGSLLELTRKLIELRKAHPILRQRTFMHGKIRGSDSRPDVTWRRADGNTPSDADWHDDSWRTVCVVLRGAAGDHEAEQHSESLFIILNVGGDTLVELPPASSPWQLLIDTNPAPSQPDSDQYQMSEQSVAVFVADD